MPRRSCCGYLKAGHSGALASVKEQPVDVWVIAATNRNLADRVAEGRFRSDLMFRLQVLWVDLPPLRERDSDVLLLAEHFLSVVAAKYRKETPQLSADARSALVAHFWPGNVRELRNVIERAALVAGENDIVRADISIPNVRSESARTVMDGSTLREIEVTTLKNALAKCDGNVSRAAQILGVSRDTLRYRIEKFGLTRRA